MRKTSWFIGIGALVACCLFLLKPWRPVTEPADFFAKFSPAVVRVITLDRAGQPLRSGSGFFVSTDGLLVTNHHVTRDGYSFSIVLSNNATWESKSVLISDAESDLALLKVNGHDLPHLEMAAHEPNVGAKVFAVGNPQGLTNTLSDGIVSGLRKGEGTLTLIQTTAPISPGSSGGPLLDTEGKVLGVTTLYLAQGQNLNFAVSSAQVQKLLTKTATATSSPPSVALVVNPVEDSQLARFWLTEATKHAAAIKFQQSQAYQEIAKGYARLKDRSGCAQTVKLARLSMVESDLTFGTDKLLAIMLNGGDVEGARQFAELHLKSDGRARAYQAIWESISQSGDLESARKFADSYLEPKARALAYRVISQSLKKRGDKKRGAELLRLALALENIEPALDEALYLDDLDAALSIAQHMQDSAEPQAKPDKPNPKSHALAMIVRHQPFLAADLNRMKTIAESIFDDQERNWSLTIVAFQLAKLGRLDEAEAIAANLLDPRWKPRIYLAIARAILNNPDRLKLREFVRQAFTAANAIEPEQQSRAFGAIADLCADAADFESAVAAAARIPVVEKDSFGGILVAPTQQADEAFNSIAVKQAKTGNWKGALATARRIQAASARCSAIESIAIETAKRGEFADAFAAASEIRELLIGYEFRSNVYEFRLDYYACLERIMTEQAKAGHYADALQRLKSFEQLPNFSFHRDCVYASIAANQGQAGLLRMALENAAKIDFENTRADAFRAIANATIRYASGADLRSWIAQLSTPVERCYACLGVADALSEKEIGVAPPASANTAQPE